MACMSVKIVAIRGCKTLVIKKMIKGTFLVEKSKRLGLMIAGKRKPLVS